MAVQELSTSRRGRGRGHAMGVAGGEDELVRVATHVSSGGALTLDSFLDVRLYSTDERPVRKCPWY